MRYEGRRMKDEGRKNAGFTLVELIIVVIVIGILAAVGMPQYTKAIEKARSAEASAGLQNIHQGEKIYFANNEVYLSAGTSGTLDNNGMTNTEETSLDINLPQTGWNFVVTTASNDTVYNITATRKKGTCKDRKIIHDHKGNLIDNGSGAGTKSEWEECQEGL